MDSSARGKPRPGFFSDRRGSTAMEFAMLAIPFALLVFAILESCISFAGQEVMANVTDDVARQLRTGQLQRSNVTEASIKQLICSRLEIMVAKDCPGLLVDLREYP
ncbi:MAG: pilus assembly protein, partial [Mesorhizobium sp.]